MTDEIYVIAPGLRTLPMRKMLFLACAIAGLCPLFCLTQCTQREARAIARFENELKASLADDGINGSISAAIQNLYLHPVDDAG